MKYFEDDCDGDFGNERTKQTWVGADLRSEGEVEWPTFNADLVH